MSDDQKPTLFFAWVETGTSQSGADLGYTIPQSRVIPSGGESAILTTPTFSIFSQKFWCGSKNG